MQHSADTSAITGMPQHAKPEPVENPGCGSVRPAAQDMDAQTGADANNSVKIPAMQKRGRPRKLQPQAGAVKRSQKSAATLEAALVAETGAVISNLKRQGVLKPPAAEQPGGGPGHRTKNCRPVQINLSETMFRQLKMIAATESISIKDQIIAALLQQGYKG